MANDRLHAQALGKRSFWTEFFALYESLPALWDLNDPLYKDRHTKAQGYEMLVMKMREIEPNACREDVLRKINIFRTNYRRECARINSSNQLGKRYTTSLWYFHMLKFLQNQEFRKDRKRVPDDEKKILRRKMLLTKSKAGSVKSYPSSTHALQDNSSEYKNEHMKYEYLSDNENISEEHMEEAQYADERSFQQQFQNQFNTISFSNKDHSDNIKTQLGEELDVDAEDYQEIVNIENSSHTQEDELEEYESEDIKTKESRKETSDSTPPELKEQPITYKIAKPYINTNKPLSASIEQQSRTDRPLISEASEILAKSWAIQYEEMSIGQRIYARKAIAEILFEGCLGHLGLRRNAQSTKVLTADAVVSSQYEQVVGKNTAAENITEENLRHMDDERHTYVYTGEGGGGSGSTMHIREYMH